MKVLAFAATSSRHSINKAIVTHATQVLAQEIVPGADIDLIDLNDFEMPIYSIDRENDTGIPALAQQFFDKIGAADAVIISYAEHNGSYTAAYKNIFDWASRINAKVFQGKPMLIMSASPGPGGASNVLKAATDSAPHFGADLKANFSGGPFAQRFDAEQGKFSDVLLADTLRDALRALQSSAADKAEG